MDLRLAEEAATGVLPLWAGVLLPCNDPGGCADSWNCLTQSSQTKGFIQWEKGREPALLPPSTQIRLLSRQHDLYTYPLRPTGACLIL